MPTITVSEDTYQRLSRQASAQGTTVDDLAAPALEKLVRAPAGNGSAVDQPADEWVTSFNAWMAAVEARGDQYPPGHVTDVSREAMYEGCGE